MKQKRWSELTGRQKITILVMGTLQILLLTGALWDIRHRPADEVKGSKRMWALLSFVNFVGPIAYFVVGRRRSI